MSLNESIKKVNQIMMPIVEKLSGSEKRRAAAKIVSVYGSGGQRTVARGLKMGRNALCKRKHEIANGSYKRG